MFIVLWIALSETINMLRYPPPPIKWGGGGGGGGSRIEEFSLFVQIFEHLFCYSLLWIFEYYKKQYSNIQIIVPGQIQTYAETPKFIYAVGLTIK